MSVLWMHSGNVLTAKLRVELVLPCRLGTFHENVHFKKLEANRVNLWHTCYLGILRGAELESAVCPAQKWLISPKK